MFATVTSTQATTVALRLVVATSIVSTAASAKKTRARTIKHLDISYLIILLSFVWFVVVEVGRATVCIHTCEATAATVSIGVASTCPEATRK